MSKKRTTVEIPIKYVWQFKDHSLEFDISPQRVVDVVDDELVPLLLNESYSWSNRSQLAEDFLAMLNQRVKLASQLVDLKTRYEVLRGYIEATSKIVATMSSLQQAKRSTR